LISLPAIPGGTMISVDVMMYNSHNECCHYTIETRLPLCDVDGRCEECADPIDRLASKPTFANAKIAGDAAHPPKAYQLWSNYMGTVAARTFTYINPTSTSQNDLYALAFINMESATVPSPLLGKYDSGSTFGLQYHGPPDPNDHTGTTDMWKHDYLGTVFGLTMDRLGNTYVAHFGMYPSFVRAGKDPFTNTPWRFGSILKIDHLTGNIPKFAELPNDQTSKPGLGNVTYDFDHNLIFATNMEDGLIYRIPMGGHVSGPWTAGSTYGAFTSEHPGHEDGMVKSDARIFAIQYHCGRLYFSRFADTLHQSALTP